MCLLKRKIPRQMKSEAVRKTYVELLQASGAILQIGNVGLISIDQTQLPSHLLSCLQNDQK